MAPVLQQQVDIAVVGGGFSGIVTAWRLAREARPGTRIVLLEGERPFGAAYATESPWHVLNTPAGQMSAIPEEPAHFLGFAEARLGAAAPGDYLPRRLYRHYLATLRDEAIARGVVCRPAVAQTVTREADRGFALTCSSGRVFHAREVVLAVGAGAPSVPGALAELCGHPQFFIDPWAPAACAGADASGAIALIGTGQTAIDVALELVRRGYRGTMTAISRRGLLPGVREDDAARRTATLDLAAMPRGSAVALQRWWRKQVAAIGHAQAAHALLRPHSAGCWQTLSPAVRARLLRHARPYWEIDRHRLAPAVAHRLAGMRAAGRLEIVASRIRSASAEAGGITLGLQPRGSKSERQSRGFTRVINCTGFGGLAGAKASPLLDGLLGDGLVRPGRHDLGVESVADGLHIIGALRRGQSWETTAVPELARQCRETAATLCVRQAENPAGQADATVRPAKLGYAEAPA